MFVHSIFQPTHITMKRSMIQRRQDAERERIERCDAALRRVMHRARPTPDFSRAIEEAERGFEGVVVRDPQSWRPQMKTRDAARLRLAAARHLFALYPVPATLERIWIDDTGLGADEVRLRRQWYVTAARGGSLYKAGARMHEWHRDIAAIERIEAMRRRAHGRSAHTWAATRRGRVRHLRIGSGCLCPRTPEPRESAS